MSYESLEKVLSEETSVYKFTLTAAARANELSQGSTPLVKTNSKKVSTVAMKEIVAGKVKYEAKGKKSK